MADEASGSAAAAADDPPYDPSRLSRGEYSALTRANEELCDALLSVIPESGANLAGVNVTALKEEMGDDAVARIALRGPNALRSFWNTHKRDPSKLREWAEEGKKYQQFQAAAAAAAEGIGAGGGRIGDGGHGEENAEGIVPGGNEESAEGLGVAAGAAATAAAVAAGTAGGNAVDVAGQPPSLPPLRGFVQRRHHPPLGHGHGHGLAVTNGGPGPAVVQIQVPGRVFWIPQQYYPQLLQYLEQLQGQHQHLPPVANHAGANGGAGIGVGAGVGAQQGQHHQQQVSVPVPMPMPVPMPVPMQVPMPGQMQMMPGQGQPGQGAMPMPMPPPNQQYYQQPPINMVGGGLGGVVGGQQQPQVVQQQHQQQQHQQANPQYAVANQGWGQPQQQPPQTQQQQPPPLQQGQPQPPQVQFQQPPAETGGVGLGAGGGLGGDGVGGPNDAVVAAAAAGVAAMNVGQHLQQPPSQQNLAGTGTGLNGEGEGGGGGGGGDAVGDSADDQQPQPRPGAPTFAAGLSTPVAGAGGAERTAGRKEVDEGPSPAGSDLGYDTAVQYSEGSGSNPLDSGEDDNGGYRENETEEEVDIEEEEEEKTGNVMTPASDESTQEDRDRSYSSHSSSEGGDGSKLGQLRTPSHSHTNEITRLLMSADAELERQHKAQIDTNREVDDVKRGMNNMGKTQKIQERRMDNFELEHQNLRSRFDAFARGRNNET